MSKYLPEARPAVREAVCRACHEPISKGEHIIAWHSWCNRGMAILLHEECAIKIGLMAMTVKGERENE
jgi:hypothetical protein